MYFKYIFSLFFIHDIVCQELGILSSLSHLNRPLPIRNEDYNNDVNETYSLKTTFTDQENLWNLAKWKLHLKRREKQFVEHKSRNIIKRKACLLDKHFHASGEKSKKPNEIELISRHSNYLRSRRNNANNRRLPKNLCEDKLCQSNKKTRINNRNIRKKKALKSKILLESERDFPDDGERKYKDWERSFPSSSNDKTMPLGMKAHLHFHRQNLVNNQLGTIPELDDPTIYKDCLICPPKRVVESQKGLDWVPLYIPEPINFCNNRRDLDYKVEVSPRSMTTGYPMKEGHYYINVSILGGQNGSIYIKDCIYEYQVKVPKCPQPRLVEKANADCSAGNAWGSVCLWKCNPGWILKGSPVTSCEGTSKKPIWSNVPPKCTIYGCRRPPYVKGHQVICLRAQNKSKYDKESLDGMFPISSICKIKCQDGYIPNHSSFTYKGLTEVECLSTGQWSLEMTDLCIEKRKVPPPIFRDCMNTNVTLQDGKPHYLTLPKYYSLNGLQARVYCDRDAVYGPGQFCRTCRAWDEARSLTAACRQCINASVKQECMAIQAPRNAKMKCTSYKGKMLCSITCSKGFVLPPVISSGKIFCKPGDLLWNFQSQVNEKLPACILR